MKQYPVNEIFYTLQGEGHNAGRPAVFIRLSGCNLECPFCDTDFSLKTMMNREEIIAKVTAYNCDLIVITGGEPSLYIDKELIDLLHKHNFEIAVETNGTHKLPDEIDWITLSPKTHISELKNAAIKQRRCDEIKLVWDDFADMYEIANDYYIKFNCNIGNYYIQPCDTGDKEKNRQLLEEAIRFCLANPEWRLSVQLHKILKIK